MPFKSSYVLIRCPGKGPKRENVNNVTLFQLGEGCGIEGEHWRVAGVRLGASHINVSFAPPVEISLGNFKWPESLPDPISRELQLHPLVTVPFPSLNVPVWTGKVLGVTKRGMSPVSLTGLGLGSSSLLLIILVVALYYALIYRRKISGLVNAVREKAGEVVEDLKKGDRGMEENAPGMSKPAVESVALEVPTHGIPQLTVDRLINANNA